MFFINFGKWSSSHGKMFTCWRVYANGWKWTPIIEITRRYNRPILTTVTGEERTQPTPTLPKKDKVG